MLRWLWGKKDVEETRPAVAAAAPVPAEAPAAPAVDWAGALAQAQAQAQSQGDDGALLALARGADTPLATKLAAVEALATEAALKLAEREFRSHDRRVHQLAKRRLQARVLQRQTLERAEALLHSARLLVEQADVPVNRITALDREWQALEATAITPAQQAAFEALAARLAAQLRERADAEARHRRWQADATAALLPLQAACTAAAQGTLDRAGLGAAITAARSLADAPPPDAPAAGQQALAQLQRALATAELLDRHLAALEPGVAPPPGDVEAPLDTPALPPLPDAALAACIEERHARARQARDEARQARQQQGREQARERQRARRDEAEAALADGVARAEAALDAGQLAEAQRLLGEFPQAPRGSEVPAALQARVQAAQARLAQLRGWQHWAGARAREELVLQAEALAAATVAGPAADDAPAGDPDVAADVARLSIRQRADLIQTLRQRWKDIDDLGGADAQALWRRFDAALAAAGQPVAEHMAAQRAAREANLAARQALLEVLEALDVDAAGAAGSEGAAPPGEAPAADAARPLASALAHFRTEWRKLGPLEHTVPRAARAALASRMEAAVARLEAPLQAARVQAIAQRQALLARAQALAGDATVRDLVGSVRALQAEWQQQARQLPLARADEQSLWTGFRAALDAAFAARQAAQQAREAEFEGHAAERQALIDSLQQATETQAPALRRLLAEAEAAWRRCGPAPRARAAALDAAFQSACEALGRRLQDSAGLAWQARCDALEARLAAQPAAEGQPSGADEIDGLLLQIEIDWELPSPPAFEPARRARKLLAMKQALEGRRAADPAPLSADAALERLLAGPGLDADRRARLAAVLAARRRRGPPRGR